jgi:PAS domain S-box-containing protein
MLGDRMETRIEELRRYVRFSDQDARLLAAFAPRAAAHFRRIAQEFYERIREHEDAHAVLTGEEQISRLQDSMVRWLERVFGGVYDAAYFEKTAQIGRVHVKVGLPQRYMPAAMSLIRSSLTTVAFEALGADARPTVDALSRLLDLELAIMLETYREDLIARVERSARKEQEGRRATAVEEHHVKAVELAPLVVVGLDASGSILLFNREAERATGYAQDEVLARSFVELFVPEACRAQAAARFSPNGAQRGTTTELPLLTRSGRVRDLEWHVLHAPARDERDAVTFVFGTDVTEQRIERERQQREKKLAALGTLAAGLAHEIRNPLNGARLHVSFLQRSLSKNGGSPDALEAVRVIDDEIQRLARLVADFLDFAQPRPLTRGPASVRALCERSLQLVSSLAKDGNVSLTADLPGADVIVEADAHRLEQVMLNLLNNAIEAVTPGGGGKVVVRARREPRSVWIEVEDDGPGLPSGDAPVFDAFYSTKPNGTGLGLSIVHRIVSDHGGTIEVDSRPGQTRFRLRLPLKHGEADA